MKICLVTPPSPFLIDERVFPALGVLRVGAVLEQAGHQVDHLDLCGVTNYEDALSDYQGAAVFGVTATTPQVPAAIRIGSLLRQKSGAKTIIGGPHATLVHAAAKRGNERAKIALDYLLSNFDVVVAGDGEKAIFTALHSRGLVDADDPKAILWNTSKDFDESPWPARHLVDMDSYHYTIDGVKSTSAIAQLGCLTGNTLIVLSSGNEKRIADVGVGDEVLCYNGRIISAPVAQTYQREADDIWEIEWDNGEILRITGEHPIYTSEGWEQAARVEPGTISAHLPRVQQEFRGGVTNTEGDMVLETLPIPVANEEPESGMDGSGTEGSQRKSRVDDSRGEVSVFHGKAKQLWSTDPRDSQETVRYQEGRLEPHEAARGRAEGFGNDQGEVGGILQGADQRELEKRKNQTLSRTTGDYSESIRSEIAGNSPNGSPSVPMVRERGILDWTMRFREPQESRFHPPSLAQSDPDARRILASGRGDSGAGLLKQGMASVDGVEQGIASQMPSRSDRKTPFIWSRIISKRFIGEGTVYNLTVHPGHTYFANRMLVHNCPFHCKFCGGRNSPMLRQIRVRSPENVVQEMVYLHDRYGISGIMHFQDELNINHRGVVDLMAKMKETGIDWKQRGFVKAELFNEEQAEAMYAAGFRWLMCGFESAHPRILKNIAKNATREDNTNMLRIAHKAGIKVKALMSAGHPGESEDTILATRDWLLEEKPDDFDMTIITVYPGTPYFDEAVCIGEPVYKFETNGDALYSENTDFHLDQAYYKGRPGDYHAFVWTDYISREKIAVMRDEVEHEVRTKLGIPYASSAAAINFEHSMGQHLPSHILRTTT